MENTFQLKTCPNCEENKYRFKTYPNYGEIVLHVFHIILILRRSRLVGHIHCWHIVNVLLQLIVKLRVTNTHYKNHALHTKYTHTQNHGTNQRI